MWVFAVGVMVHAVLCFVIAAWLLASCWAASPPHSSPLAALACSVQFPRYNKMNIYVSAYPQIDLPFDQQLLQWFWGPYLAVKTNATYLYRCKHQTYNANAIDS